MSAPSPSDPGAGQLTRAFTTSFFTNTRVRRLMQAAGFALSPGLARQDTPVAVWGHRPTARRGEWLARRTRAPILRVEDALLRSLHPGRRGEAPLGLLIDTRGCYYDARQPSDLEHLLATHPLNDPHLMTRAADGMDRIRDACLSKYAATRVDLAAPEPGYVLVIDQTRDDASIPLGGASAETFDQMLAQARADHPDAPIVVKTHPETRAGLRPGHFGDRHLDARTTLIDTPLPPQHLLEGAIATYVVTSGFGFEAILQGARPVVFGQPFYAGWGLTDDRQPIARRQRALTAEQLFAGVMIEAPAWWNPVEDAPGQFEDPLGALEAAARAWRDDHQGHVATGMRLWKRPTLRRFFGTPGPLTFAEADSAIDQARRTGRPLMTWASRMTPALRQAGSAAIEDGFLRSQGLGAALTPPLSLVRDGQGIYYDPTQPSDLEGWIAKRTTLSASQTRRAEDLRQTLVERQISKYNLRVVDVKTLPAGHRVLVVGQVEDDASIRLGAGAVRTNAALLAAARQARPDAVLIYKPHPDVEAGLRPGALAQADAGLADVIAPHTDPVALIEQVDEVWTITSLLGFEALLRGAPVTCLGVPFYAGWGLTTDQADTPDRRQGPVPLAGLIHAALIDYPRYYDPISGLPCPVEVAVARLSADLPGPGPTNRTLSKLQGLLASYSWLWR